MLTRAQTVRLVNACIPGVGWTMVRLLIGGYAMDYEDGRTDGRTDGYMLAPMSPNKPSHCAKSGSED